MSETKGRGVTATIKYGKGYEAPWAVFHGTSQEVHADITEYFGLNPEDTEAYTTHELVIQLSSSAIAGRTVGNLLDADVVPEGDDWPRPVKKKAPEPEGSESDEPKKEPKSEEQALLDIIASTDTVKQLKALYHANRETFEKDEGLRDVWKARGKELQQQAA